ncbi:neurogenic locus Notch protein-like [Anneissia japonica]|uniref:neurogenic locus Notch protein-like n=1 Tax=Anneissia japonica TaxID=1529436 RepID=UPI0014259E79|nr:neurogenic locus Notch protein-like [Anneissia japonica]
MKNTVSILLVFILFLSFSNAQTACNSLPCLHGGTCFNSETGNKFLCLCTKGYAGIQCEISLPGTCAPDYRCIKGNCKTDINGIPHCNCSIGYKGENCDESMTTTVTACEAFTPCQNDGTCFTLSSDISSYFCACPLEYTGKHCDMKITSLADPCLPSPCENGGNCTLDASNPSGYHCTCPVHFSGQNCSTDDTISCTFEGNIYYNREVRETGCNLCTCYDGNWACTMSSCGGICRYEDKIFFEDDSRQDDCNTCYCIHGAWVCTMKHCFNGNECEFVSSDYVELYSENQHRWEECNVCYCLSASWACTNNDCSNRTVIGVSFDFDGDFDSIVDITEHFKLLLHQDLSMTFSIPMKVIEHLESSGSSQAIHVSFSLVGSQDGAVDVEKMSSEMQKTINNGEYRFVFNTATYPSSRNSFSSTLIWPENPTKTKSGVDSSMVLLIVCALAGLGFIVIIFGVTLYIKTANTKRKDTKYGSAQLPNRRTGLETGDQARLTSDRAATLPSNLHI